MKLFDIQGNKVVIHNDALGIPCFKDIWNKYKDKSIAMNIISYIVLNNHPDSPYVVSMDKKTRESKLKKELFPDGIKETDELKYAESMYIEFTDTLSLKMLRGIRVNLEQMSESLQTLYTNGMTMRDMKELLDLSSKADKAIKSIYALEKQVRKDELSASTVRGGSEIGQFELPKTKNYE